jgi:hypothetical protein
MLRGLEYSNSPRKQQENNLNKTMGITIKETLLEKKQNLLDQYETLFSVILICISFRCFILHHFFSY